MRVSQILSSYRRGPAAYLDRSGSPLWDPDSDGEKQDKFSVLVTNVTNVNVRHTVNLKLRTRAILVVVDVYQG
jgi:hypothetical protein